MRHLPADTSVLPDGRRQRCIEAALLALLCLIPILLYLPFLWVPFERDEGVYATIAQGVLDGKVPYRDLFDNKPPLVFAWYAVSFLIFGESVIAPRLVAAFFLSLTAVVLYQQARLVLPRPAAWISAFLFAISTGLPFVALHANTEAYMLLPLVSSLMFFTIGMKRGGNRWFFIAGILAGAAIMTKQVAVWNLFALAALALYYHRQTALTLWKALSPAAWLLTGAAVSVGAIIAPFIINGALDDLVYANVRFNILWTGSLSNAQRLANLGDGMLFFSAVAAPFVAGAIAGLFVIWKRRASVTDYLLIAWGVGSVVGVATGGRFFPHYFLHLMPILAILTGVLVDERFFRGRQIALSKPAAITAALVLMTSVGTTAVLYLSPAMAEEQVSPGTFQQKEWEASSDELGLYLRERTGPGDSIFNYGRESQVYFYADREPAIPYFYDRVVEVDAAPIGLIIAQLKKTRPAYIVDSLQAPLFEDWAASHPPEWQTFIHESYEYVGRIYFADVFVIKGYIPPPDAGLPR